MEKSGEKINKNLINLEHEQNFFQKLFFSKLFFINNHEKTLKHLIYPL